MRKLKICCILVAAQLFSISAFCQETAPINGVADNRTDCFAFTHATIFTSPANMIADASLVIRKGKIIAAGTGITIPADAVVTDCKGKYIYASFIDLYTDYGIAPTVRPAGAAAFTPAASNTNGAMSWNPAIHPEVNAATLFTADEAKAKTLRETGFGVVLTHRKDGIARGTGTLTDLSGKKDNLAMIREKASSHYSFSKGTSTESYPQSLMGSIALLRQTALDARWYKTKPATEGSNLGLQEWNNNMSLPQIFEANDKWNDMRADRIGDEMGVQFIIKAGQNEFERMAEIKSTNAKYILPLNFPEAIDAEDLNDIRFVTLGTLKQWEMAPTQPAAFERSGIPFCLTTSDLRDVKSFRTNLRKAIDNGLSESVALAALTENPARFLNIQDEVGTLEPGKRANFIITTGPVFEEKTILLQNWIRGEKFLINDDATSDTKGKYALHIYGNGIDKNYTLDVKDKSTADLIRTDTLSVKYSNDGKMVRMNFGESKRAISGFRLTGVNMKTMMQGNGTDSAGNGVLWTASYVSDLTPKADTAKKKPKIISSSKLTYPNMAYGYSEVPKAENIIIKNATVWTSDAAGKLLNTDVLVENGKIAAIGKGLSASGARVIDGTGKHLSAGIIDEHSHIAAASINEGGQSVSSEVRIGDNLNPDDVDIYRQLGGGVTTSHILHGSANTIGGQTQLIKHRWGVNDTALKFKGADGFIKFALGENVKRTSSQNNTRFPDTRMGVEQVQMDAFTRALDYKHDIAAGKPVRRDLELDALVEILDHKRFITCHSYVQSEITEMMRVAEKFGFTVNTFTHILEGYKVADKLKAHGANASTFSDWWAYKMEVQDAIAYNAAIMHKEGLNVAINSDDPEMARRLNQEAAKTVKYGGLSEEDALNMVTINPAKMLHVDKMTGSIKKGKDADLVLWTANPLSIYAVPEYTIVDGVIYYSLENDLRLRKEMAAERNRIIQKLIAEKRSGGETIPARTGVRPVNRCEEDDEDNASN